MADNLGTASAAHAASANSAGGATGEANPATGATRPATGATPAASDGNRQKTGTSIEFRNVRKVFHQGKREIVALDDVNISIPAGSIV